MRLCFVIQRYGTDLAGGSETHCRWLAGRLARSHRVQVLTTCAFDYIEWRNHYPPGATEVEGIPVTRYPVRRPRSERRFALVQDLVFNEDHTLDDEREWVVENGPFCPDLLRALDTLSDVDLFVFYSYRYYQTFFGLPMVSDRAVLVPTAEEDPAIELSIFGELFRAPRGILYLTPEERALVQGVSGNAQVRSAVVGSGVNVPAPDSRMHDVRARFDLPESFLLYVGRIDRNKGADTLFSYYRRLEAESSDAPPLILVGTAALEIPQHPKIRHLGFVSEQEKYALLESCDVLLMPSPYESLSVIALEAWAMGRPILANAACKVLEGQCIRSGGGLFYRGYSEFAAALTRLLGDSRLRHSLGDSGRAYVSREYDWDVVERRTLEFLEQTAGA